jgi:hypothetical protein
MASPVKERLKTVRVPLVGSYNQRGIDAYDYYDTNSTFKDQRFVGFIPTVVQNPFTGSGTAYIEKRTGLVSSGDGPGGSLKGRNIFVDKFSNAVYANFVSGSTTNVYRNGNFIGTIGSGVHAWGETSNSSSSSGNYILMSSSSGVSHYIFNSLLNTALTTFTADTTSGSPTLTNVTGTSLSSQLQEGQLISGTGIATGTRISAYNSGAGTITMTLNATATNSTVTITYEHIQKILDSNFISNTMIGPMVPLNGYIYMMDTDGNIWNSNLNDPFTWNSTDFVATGVKPDLGSGLCRIKHYIMAFSSGSIEFFEDVGNASGSPLQRVPNLLINTGVVGGGGNHTPFTQFRDFVFWYGTSIGSGTTGVWMMDESFRPQRISTPVIERILAPYAPNGIIDAFEYAGKTFLYIGASNAVTLFPSFLYCVETKEWIETGFPYNMKIACDYYEPLMVALNHDSGLVYQWTQGIEQAAVYQDAGSAYTATVQTSKLDFGTEKRKRFHKVALIGDTQASTATVNISWSDDDYDNFSTARSVDMSNDRAYLTNCGAARRRAFKITNATNTPLRLEALEITYSELEK